MQMYDPNIWGPTFWSFLDIIAFHYPKYPNDVIKKKYYDFIQNIPLFIPHDEMSKQFQTFLNLYPIKPYLDDRKSLIKWVHFINNKINEILDKPTLTIEMYYSRYYEKYKVVRTRKNRISYLVMLFLIAVIIYYYKK
jgi:hypothetical protein